VSALVVLAGCKGFWDAPTTGGSGSFPASGVFYVLNSKTTQVTAYQFAANSSGPTALTGSPYTLSSLPYTMAIAPSGNFLYVSTVSGIYVYSVASDGTLTIANSGGVISSDAAFAMKVDATGTWLVEVVSGQGVVKAVPISASSGLLDSTRTEKSTPLPTVTISQLAISPANSTNPYVFIAMGSGGTAVVPFTAANATPFGTVSQINLLNNAGGALAVAVDPSNRLLYVGETAALTTGTQTGGLRVFTIGASSAITEITGSPYSTGGTGPSAILPGTSDIYVANKAVSGSTDGNITGFSLAATGTTTITYSLTTISTIAAGISTNSLAADSTGTYVLAANPGGSPDLSTFTFDTTTSGKLDAAATAATGTDPVQAVTVVAHP
jgi:6-phosphogluconolactonase (cycloisomerase 2 family)